MGTTDERIQLLVEARNGASGTLKQVKSDLGGIEGAAKMLSGGLGGVFGALGVASVAGLGMAAVQMGKLGAASLEMRASFDDVARSAGMSSDAILASMRAASEGMVADTELVAGANQALLMGAATNAEQLGQLMEVAKVRSDAMGISVSEAFSSLAQGIGRVAERQLYALGIQLDLEKVNADYAASLGKTSSALSENEKREALRAAVIADSAAMVASAVGLSDADKLDQAATAWANLKTSIGEALSPAVVVAAEALTAAMNEMAGNSVGAKAAAVREDFDGIARSIAEFQRQLSITDNMGGPFGAENVAKYERVQADLAAAKNDLGGMLDNINQVSASFAAAGGSVSNLTRDVAGLAAQMAVSTAEAEALAKIVDSYGSKIHGAALGAAGSIGGSGALAWESDLNRKMQERGEILRANGYTATQAEYELQALYAGDIAKLDDMKKAQAALGDEVRATKGGVSDLDRAYSDLKGRVAGVLQSALGDTGGANVADFLPREDAVAENARRLADIMVNGLKGQDWLGEFANEVPDVFKLIASSSDPKAMAASLLKDFQDGLRPDLLDKERAKELVRIAILGDQNISALAEEISAELAAEMNISLGLAQQAASSVLGTGGSGEGSGLIAQGMNGSGEGNQFMDALSGAIKGRAAELFASGQEVGTQWGAGFMAVVETGVPSSLIGLLATLVTPAVMAAFATGNTQRGAMP